MEYNTQKKKLLLPEYGRNIQKMVDYLLTIEDREERTRAAKTVIDVMEIFILTYGTFPISGINFGIIWPSCLNLNWI